MSAEAASPTLSKTRCTLLLPTANHIKSSFHSAEPLDLASSVPQLSSQLNIEYFISTIFKVVQLQSLNLTPAGSNFRYQGMEKATPMFLVAKPIRGASPTR
jgi:hypothetical protein